MTSNISGYDSKIDILTNNEQSALQAEAAKKIKNPITSFFRKTFASERHKALESMSKGDFTQRANVKPRFKTSEFGKAYSKLEIQATQVFNEKNKDVFYEKMFHGENEEVTKEYKNYFNFLPREQKIKIALTYVKNQNNPMRITNPSNITNVNIAPNILRDTLKNFTLDDVKSFVNELSNIDDKVTFLLNLRYCKGSGFWDYVQDFANKNLKTEKELGLRKCLTDGYNLARIELASEDGDVKTLCTFCRDDFIDKVKEILNKNNNLKSGFAQEIEAQNRSDLSNDGYFEKLVSEYSSSPSGTEKS